MRRKIIDGQLVRVVLPVDDPSLKPIQKYDGQKMRVKYTHFAQRKNGDTVLRTITMYALDGAVSPSGEPYWFIDEWLQEP